MQICQLDKEIEGIIKEFHVYGAECVINALVRACDGENYLNAQSLHTLIEGAFDREYALSEDQE